MNSVVFKVVCTHFEQLDTIPTTESHVLQLFTIGGEDCTATLAALR